MEDTVEKLEEELRTKNELMTSLDRKFEELQTKILQLHLDNERQEEEEEEGGKYKLIFLHNIIVSAS